MVETQPENMNKNQQIGFHLGSVSTLSKERSELLRIVGITEQLIQMHIKALAELGVDISKFQSSGNAQQKPSAGPKPPLDDIL